VRPAVRLGDRSPSARRCQRRVLFRLRGFSPPGRLPPRGWCGFVAPRCQRRFAAFHASWVRSGLNRTELHARFPRRGFIPLEELPSPAAAPCHHGRCPPAVIARSVTFASCLAQAPVPALLQDARSLLSFVRACLAASPISRVLLEPRGSRRQCRVPGACALGAWPDPRPEGRLSCRRLCDPSPDLASFALILRPVLGSWTLLGCSLVRSSECGSGFPEPSSGMRSGLTESATTLRSRRTIEAKP